MILKTQFSIFCNDFPLLFYPQLPKKLTLRFPPYIYIHQIMGKIERKSDHIGKKTKELISVAMGHDIYV